MANTCCGGSAPSGRRVKKTACCGASAAAKPSSACCGEQLSQKEATEQSAAREECFRAEYVIGRITTPVGDVPQIATKLAWRDRLGAWKCRWDIGRMDYKVAPGLYAVGEPDASSPVLVTANYERPFGRLREQLDGLNLWLVVLDTDGVNVWCAAGRGTFGTDGLVERLRLTQLSKIVSHRTVILPQLGASGIAAHEAAERSGFCVIYGPVRARDVKAFLAAGNAATESMRTVRFTLANRLTLTPVELVGAFKPLLLAFGVLFVLNAVGFGHYSWADLYGVLGAAFVGAFLTPALLPWIPGRAFSLKGALLGLLWTIGFLFLNGLPAAPAFGWLKAAAYLLLFPALSGYLALNFTGSSTFTSLSGVDKEMKFAIPAMLFAAAGAGLLLLAGDGIRLFGGALI